MALKHTQYQVQRSVDLKDRVETNGRTDGRTDRTDCIICLANAKSKYITVNEFDNGQPLLKSYG